MAVTTQKMTVGEEDRIYGNMLEEVIDIICGECKGKCCRNFPVFVKDRRFKRMYKNPIYFSRDDNELWLQPNIIYPKDIDCYYYHKGGCPDHLRPEECSYWYCYIYDEFVLGMIRPFKIGLNAKQETMEIIKLLKVDTINNKVD